MVADAAVVANEIGARGWSEQNLVRDLKLKFLINSGKSYKHFTSGNYDPRVVIWQFSSQYDSRVVNYDRKVLYKIAHRLCHS